MRSEEIIISNLICNSNYFKKVLPFLKEEYFSSQIDRKLFAIIYEYIIKYNACPTEQALLIELNSITGLAQEEYDGIAALIKRSIEQYQTQTEAWLLEFTEKFCQEKAIYNAVVESIDIIENKKSNVSKNAIPGILQKALGVSFNTNVGHDYIDDMKNRYDFYHRQENKIPFDIYFWNKITKNGFSNKTLNVLVAPTNGGKSIFLCHCAASALRLNKKVLYITCEMSEERIGERIDANISNTSLSELSNLPWTVYEKKLKRATENLKGKLIIKEYPTSSASVVHFQHLLSELKMKKDFVPDIIFVDYLNICVSSRYKISSAVNSYTLVKAIAEELRGLAQEYDVPVVTASQVNRAGLNNSDVNLENTSESIGTSFTADFIMAMITTEELDKLGQVLFKQLKNRYEDKTINKKFLVGLDRSKMRFYDLDAKAQNGLSDSGQIEEEEKLFTSYEETDKKEISSNPPVVTESEQPQQPKSPEEYMNRIVRQSQEKNYNNSKFADWK
jgi:replicative DNA helicase